MPADHQSRLKGSESDHFNIVGKMQMIRLHQMTWLYLVNYYTIKTKMVKTDSPFFHRSLELVVAALRELVRL